MYRTRFYLVREDHPDADITYAIKHCTRPKQTKAYKSLTNMLDQEKIIRFGYHITE